MNAQSTEKHSVKDCSGGAAGKCTPLRDVTLAGNDACLLGQRSTRSLPNKDVLENVEMNGALSTLPASAS